LEARPQFLYLAMLLDLQAETYLLFTCL
jgi:hypothetical protein